MKRRQKTCNEAQAKNGGQGRLSSALPAPPACVDTGAARTMTGDWAHVAYKHATTQEIQFADGNLATGHSADLVFYTKDTCGDPITLSFPNGLFCPDLSVTLISVSQLTAAGFCAYFSAKESHLCSPNNQVVPLDFDTASGLWFLPTTPSPKPQANDVSRKSNEDRNRPGKNIRRMLSFYLCHTGIIHAIEMFRGEEIYTKRKYIVMTLKK